MSRVEPVDDPEYAKLLQTRLQQIAAALDDLDNELSSTRDESEGRLKELLSALHEADLSDLLETLQPGLRGRACGLIDKERMALVINDMDEAASRALLSELDDPVLLAALSADPDLEDVEAILRRLPPKRRADILSRAQLSNNLKLLQSLSYAQGTVGELLDFQHLTVAVDADLAAVTAKLRTIGKLPSHCDKLFVVDGKRLVGVLTLKKIITEPADAPVADVMVKQLIHSLKQTDAIEDAVDLFERYDLISAPVINNEGDVVGRVTVDEIVREMRDETHSHLITASGLREEEDLYAPIAQRLRNRSLWIFINLIAAFMVSRIVGSYEATIVQVVALASLMPVIASVAGNAGLQTSTIVIRALAFNQLQLQNWHMLLGRELLLGAVNGVFWGLVVSLFGFVFYQDLQLSLVLCVSMIAVFLLAASGGFLVPIIVQSFKGDPALGTSVIVTTLVDCLGFLTFLSLATLLLV